ncbi:MAG: hypothetical protein ACYDAP_05950 [Thermoplasmataceae archaeon]
MINISDFKRKLTAKYPNSGLSQLLVKEPDIMTESEFQIKSGMWLKIAEMEAHKQ